MSIKIEAFCGSFQESAVMQVVVYKYIRAHTSRWQCVVGKQTAFGALPPDWILCGFFLLAFCHTYTRPLIAVRLVGYFDMQMEVTSVGQLVALRMENREWRTENIAPRIESLERDKPFDLIA